MRICVLAPEFLPNWGGTGTYLVNLLTHLPPTVEIHVLTVRRGAGSREQLRVREETVELMGRKLQVHYLSNASEHFFYNVNFQLSCLKELPALCKEFDFDIVQTNYPHMPDLPSRLMGRVRLPIVATVHDLICLKRYGILSSGTAFPNLEPSDKSILTLYPVLNLLENLYFRNPPVLVAPSNFCARMLRNLGVKSQIHLIPNGIDTEVFSRMNIRSSRPTILFAGRFVSQKGVNTIIDSIPRILDSFPDARFMFAGATMPDRYTQLVKSHGIPGDSVEFFGFVNNLEMPRFYSLANVYVLPSIYENCPMGVLEAMSCQTPVVAGYGGGTGEIIEPGKSGLLIPPKDSAALANSIITLLQDTRLAARIGEEGRKRVLAGFSAEKMANSTMQLFEEVVRAYKK